MLQKLFFISLFCALIALKIVAQQSFDPYQFYLDHRDLAPANAALYFDGPRGASRFRGRLFSDAPRPNVVALNVSADARDIRRRIGIDSAGTLQSRLPYDFNHAMLALRAWISEGETLPPDERPDSTKSLLLVAIEGHYYGIFIRFDRARFELDRVRMPRDPMNGWVFHRVPLDSEEIRREYGDVPVVIPAGAKICLPSQPPRAAE